MAVKRMALRYAGTCSVCAAALERGTKAWWDGEARTVTCVTCQSIEPALPPDPEPPPSPEPAPSPPPIATGEAGASARREYERRHQKREQRLDDKWGRLAGVAKFLSVDPQSTQAWAKGSEGERKLAASLMRSVGDRAILLHDRKVPRTKGNIDHLAVAASGVWIIDAKRYAGKVERRDVGGFFKTDMRLYVGGRDRTKIADGLGWQVNAVRTALDGVDVPVHSALCFIDAEWNLFAKPFQHDGVWVTWAAKLAEMIAAPGPLGTDDVAAIGGRLATALPPTVASTNS